MDILLSEINKLSELGIRIVSIIINTEITL